MTRLTKRKSKEAASEAIDVLVPLSEREIKVKIKRKIENKNNIPRHKIHETSANQYIKLKGTHKNAISESQRRGRECNKREDSIPGGS